MRVGNNTHFCIATYGTRDFMLFGDTWLIFLEKKNYDFKNGVCRRMRRNQINAYFYYVIKRENPRRAWSTTAACGGLRECDKGEK